MIAMLIVLLVMFILAVALALMVTAIAVMAHNHRLIVEDEGWERPLGPLGFSDLDEGDDSPPIVPERTIEESDAISEELVEALANGPGEPITLVRCPPEWDCGEVCIPEEAAAAQAAFEQATFEAEKEAPADGIVKEGIEVPLATGGVIDPAQVAIIGQPDHIETVIPLEPQAEIVTQVQQATASQPATEWKRWNKP